MPTFRIGDRVRIRAGAVCAADCRVVGNMVGRVVCVLPGLEPSVGVRWTPITPAQRRWCSEQSNNLNGHLTAEGVASYRLGGWFAHPQCIELVDSTDSVVYTTMRASIALCGCCTAPCEDGGDYCLYCLGNDKICTSCASVVHAGETYDHGDCGGGPFCEECYGIHCNECEDSDDDPPDSIIHNYYYQPSPLTFHGIGPRFFGVELEIDGGGYSEYNAASLLELSDEEELFYIKPDGSLNDGLEIVTQPCSLEFHCNEFPWAEITKQAAAMGYKSHDTATCGLHVHVSRAALGSDYTHQDTTLSKLIVLFWRHWEHLVSFSRRTPLALAQWAKLNYTAPTVDDDHIREAKELGKYAAINTEHRATLEIRIFRGTLRVETILASIELVDLLCDLAMQWDIGHCVGSTWGEVVAAAGERWHLRRYLASDRMTTAKGGD